MTKIKYLARIYPGERRFVVVSRAIVDMKVIYIGEVIFRNTIDTMIREWNKNLDVC